MKLQGLNSNVCNLPAIPFRVEDANNEKNQMYREASKEVKAGADMNGHGITDSTPVHVAGDDIVFANNVLPTRNTAHGTFTLLSQSLLLFWLLLYSFMLNNFRIMPAWYITYFYPQTI